MLVTAAFLLAVFAYSLISRRIDGTLLTAPMIFTAAGALLLLIPGAEIQLLVDRKSVLLIAEVGLVMTLFTDASRIPLQSLRGDRNLPVRLLSVGMLLTIALGAAAALVCFGGLSVWEAGIIAAILAPTDAGLGQVIVNSREAPLHIRQALNVEAGLNDGLSVPFLMLFIAFAAARESGGAHTVLGRYLLEQLGYGAAIGLAVGLIGGALIGFAQRRRWIATALTQTAVVALPLICVVASEETGASMFIAAYVAGLAVQRGFPHVARHSVEFSENWGQLFNFFVFFVFGLFVALAVGEFAPATIVYAVLSLTVVRMVPVAISLIGTHMSRATVLFIGWFGPRGLASIVLGLVYLEQQARLPNEPIIRHAVMATVLLSIVAHGISAVPGIHRYARAIRDLPAEAPEHGGQDANPAERAQ
ncbi:MAG TPA: cation:proton antiporter [Burkholderiaceae bacterium]|nr:cation:proton antiporter [Burkholderiaceae bacterium]